MLYRHGIVLFGDNQNCIFTVRGFDCRAFLFCAGICAPWKGKNYETIKEGVVAPSRGSDNGNGSVHRSLVLNFDPVFEMANNKHQHELLDWWNDPHWLADEFSSDLKEISHGYANYKVVDWIDINELPKNKKGESYTLDYYYDTLVKADKATDGAYWQYSGWKMSGFSFDYNRYLTEYDVYNRVNKGEIDEVWIFTGPMIGAELFETMMVGRGAYFVNGTPLEYDCKPFIVYGFNYERGVGEMLEDAGHRAEFILSKVMGETNYKKDYSEYSDWEKFTAHEKVSPGKSGVGNIHFAPNSVSDYDWGNKTYVYSTCNDWVNYPNMNAEPTKVNCSTWGNGDIREHHKWWFSLLPHAQGINSKTGFYNNWWFYFTLEYINSKKELSTLNISTISDKAYTGKARKPDVTIKDGDYKLVYGTDYTLSFKNNQNIGIATITIKGKGNYTGTKTVNFKIIPAKTTVKATRSGERINLRWGAVSGIDKYQIYYSTDGGKTYKRAGSVAGTKSSCALALPSGKTYTIIIRSYKTVNGKTYYSKWSDAVTVK